MWKPDPRREEGDFGYNWIDLRPEIVFNPMVSISRLELLMGKDP